MVKQLSPYVAGPRTGLRLDPLGQVPVTCAAGQFAGWGPKV